MGVTVAQALRELSTVQDFIVLYPGVPKIGAACHYQFSGVAAGAALPSLSGICVFSDSLSQRVE
jgi:hypothetical protein